MMRSAHALYFVYLKMRPFIQKARLLLPRRLYLPFSGLRLPRCSNTRIVAPCLTANWTIRALTRWARSSSRLLILRQRLALSCSPCAIMPVLLRLRAIHPQWCFLKPDISLPPPINWVARIVPSTVWMVQTAICSSRFRPIAQIVVSVLVVTCCSVFAGLLNDFSIGVCIHHSFPCLISEELPSE